MTHAVQCDFDISQIISVYFVICYCICYLFQHVEVHLRFLAFILQEGALYLQWHRAREIWDCLVANPEAHESDKEVNIRSDVHRCTDRSPGIGPIMLQFEI